MTASALATRFLACVSCLLRFVSFTHRKAVKAMLVLYPAAPVTKHTQRDPGVVTMNGTLDLYCLAFHQQSNRELVSVRGSHRSLGHILTLALLLILLTRSTS